ncbi:hypothetical protein BDF20DRAFT_839619 [Mycotypha africana]|uniref:uncharacterized protein n=1 Tax=Mycotypha africana TaxID=64632 RepID=UPI0023015B4E|nr:uncharacterized protein BDF20DRAFT_839619 [Mycotypha africana]KAI8968521.1 hypothetical protein BDF20DRAFT_839619 [Mycotypha africana]
MLVKFFDDSSLAVIQDATDDLIKNFAGLSIKKTSSKKVDFFKSCVFLDEFGFDVNMDPSRGWPSHDSPAIVESPTAKAGLQTDIGEHCTLTQYLYFASTIGGSNGRKQSIADSHEWHKALEFPIACRIFQNINIVSSSILGSKPNKLLLTRISV